MFGTLGRKTSVQRGEAETQLVDDGSHSSELILCVSVCAVVQQRESPIRWLDRLAVWFSDFLSITELWRNQATKQQDKTNSIKEPRNRVKIVWSAWKYASYVRRWRCCRAFSQTDVQFRSKFSFSSIMVPRCLDICTCSFSDLWLKYLCVLLLSKFNTHHLLL